MMSDLRSVSAHQLNFQRSFLSQVVSSVENMTLFKHRQAMWRWVGYMGSWLSGIFAVAISPFCVCMNIYLVSTFTYKLLN